MEEELKKVDAEEKEPESITMELLREVKEQSKGWRTAFFATNLMWLGLCLAMLIGFLWYCSLPVEVSSYSTEQSTDSGGDNISNIGGEYYGASEGDSGSQETSSTK